LSDSPRGLLRRGLIEVVLIVGSILLAFAIDAAWDERQTAQEADDLLAVLRTEFEANRAELTRHRDRWVGAKAATGRLLVAQATGEIPPPVVMDSLISGFMTPTTFDAPEGTLAIAAGGGKLTLLRDAELRNLLATWPGMVSEVRDNELAMREFILRVITPYLAEAGVSLARSRALVGERPFEPDAPMAATDAWPAPLPSDAAVAGAYARILRDPAFEPLLVTRYGWFNIVEYDAAIAFVDRILARIDHAEPR